MQTETLNQYPSGVTAGFDVRDFNDVYDDAMTALRTWKQRRQTRRILASVDAHSLDDIGITEAQRQVEVNKFFWEA